jgi:hypothetical protein
VLGQHQHHTAGAPRRALQPRAELRADEGGDGGDTEDLNGTVVCDGYTQTHRKTDTQKDRKTERQAGRQNRARGHRHS